MVDNVNPTTRERLIDAATRLLDGGGVDAVTLRDVGRLAGVSHNAPYKHFADKTALLAAIAANELRSLERRLQRAQRSTDDQVRALNAAGRTYVRWALTHPQRFKLTFRRWERDNEELGTAATAARVAFFAPFRVAAHTGVLRNDLDPSRAAHLVWTLAHGAVDLELASHLQKDDPSATPEALVADLVRFLTE